MQREIQLTADGSHTIALPEMKVAYHSHHGAISESRHVYIQGGLQPLIELVTQPFIRILEVGFGTGLNALLSLQEADKHQRPIHYTAIEPFPLKVEEIQRLNHGQQLLMQNTFLQLHRADWEKDTRISNFFTLRKMNVSLLQLRPAKAINCIYFDPFSPTAQPELWTQPVFEKMYACLAPGGVLVTYSSKSLVRSAMTAAGFSVKKIPGPWGKREMVRAEKLAD